MADTPTLILGADFLHHYKYLVDVARHRFIDTTTHLSISGVEAPGLPVSPVLLIPTQSTKYDTLLGEFSQITQPLYKKALVTHDVTHCIVPTVQPVFAESLPRSPPTACSS